MLKGTKMHPSEDKWDQLGKGMFEDLLCCQQFSLKIAQLSAHDPSAIEGKNLLKPKVVLAILLEQSSMR